MRFYTTPHPFYGGSDLHARMLSVCLLDQGGAVLGHRKMQTAPATFLKAMAPYRQGLGVAVESLFTQYGLADLQADAGSPFVLGPALYRKALPGGTATNDKSASPTIAALLRGGMRPQACVYPAKMRATRALLRRRRHRAPTRAALRAHVQNPNSPSNLPAMGKTSASTATREGVAERFAAAAVHKSLAVDLALITSQDARRRDVALPSVKTARPHDANTRYRRQTVPGSGPMLRLVLRQAIQDMGRFPSVQALVSSCRLVTWARASAAKRAGPAGAKIGKAHLTWAFSAAAVVCLRAQTAAQNDLARVEKTPDKGKAGTLLAQTLARAVSYRLTHQGACDREPCFHR